jgi:hypothetical protein
VTASRIAAAEFGQVQGSRQLIDDELGGELFGATTSLGLGDAATVKLGHHRQFQGHGPGGHAIRGAQCFDEIEVG